MKKFTIVTMLVFTMLFLGGTKSFAARNPAGTGQPGAECGEEGATSIPNGFTTDGFANAEEMYAGSDNSASLAHSNSEHAVSQYDVACYQITQHSQ